MIRLHRMLPFTAGLFLSLHVMAGEVGWRQVDISGSASAAAAIPVALYYPTQEPATARAMGPFTVKAAIRAAPQARVKALIILSHGTGGSELGHSSLAEALAQAGYLVAALRHPGDNWQDRSLLTQGAARYFSERPQQASRVIDALLRDPEWKDRIVSDAQGPRVAAIGHSAGGYTVLALAGGRPDVSRIAAHCAAHRADDPIFCGMARAVQPEANPATPPAAIPPLADPRVRAAVALAPVGVVFTDESLARIRIPTAIYEAQRDRFLVPRFHAGWIARNLPAAERHRIPNAGHYAFMNTPSMSIMTEDGDVAADPRGFDREAFLNRLGRETTAFFDRHFP